MNDKELLKKLGEETIYSAKGHFKACDIRRKQVTTTIWFCAILNVVAVIGISPLIDKWFAAISLFGLIALLLWNQGEGKNYRGRHKEAAESYLALHKKIRECFFLSNCSDEDINKLSQKAIDLDKSEKPEIPAFAYRLAKKAIEKIGETDNWFLK